MCLEAEASDLQEHPQGYITSEYLLGWTHSQSSGGDSPACLSACRFCRECLDLTFMQAVWAGAGLQAMQLSLSPYLSCKNFLPIHLESISLIYYFEEPQNISLVHLVEL